MVDFTLAVDALFGEERVNHGSPTEHFDFKTTLNHEYLLIDSVIRLSLANGTSYLMAQFVWQSSISLTKYLFNNTNLIKNKTVIELGAGCGLPGIASLLLSPEEVVITDYPEEEILENITKNINRNISDIGKERVKVEGLKWGDKCENNVKYDVVLMADTLWLEKEHDNLSETLKEVCKPISENGLIICAYMDHDTEKKVANNFFKILEEKNFKVCKEVEVCWRKENNCYTEEVDPYENVKIKYIQYCPK